MEKTLYSTFFKKKCVNSKKISNQNSEDNTIALWCRNSTIPSYAVGLSFKIHNGQFLIPVNVNENMVGFKFGEFAPTRKSYFFKKKKKK